MITYRNMTFCKDWKECAGGEGCPRAIAAEVIQKAEKAGLPLKVVKRLDCFRPKEKD